MDDQDALQMNALQLAYLGDTVWEMIVRYDLIIQKLNVRHMHQRCVSLVNAHSQSEILRSLTDTLTDSEKEIVRRGRNAHAKHPVPKNQDPDEYAMATGFEALLGYLYVTGKNDRISELTNHIKEVISNA
jgi:ribonuclease-3 family protein